MQQEISKRESKKIQSRNMIIQSATELFSQKGLKSTSIADIMNNSQLGIGTFYNYFQSKDDLLNHLLSHIATDIREFFVELVTKKSSNTVILKEIVLYSAQVLDKNRFILPLFMRASEKSANVALKGKVGSTALPFKALFDEIISTGQESGEFRSDIPAEIITEMFHSLFQTASFSSLSIAYYDNIAYKLDLILLGIENTNK